MNYATTITISLCTIMLAKSLVGTARSVSRRFYFSTTKNSTVLFSFSCSNRRYMSYLTRTNPIGKPQIVLRGKKQNDSKRARNMDFGDEDEEDDADMIPSPSAKGKGGSSSAKTAVKYNKPGEFNLKDTIIAFEDMIKKFNTAMSAIKIGRADPQLLASVSVDAQPLTKLGQIQVRDPQTLSVSLYDQSIATKVVKAINAADSTLEPSNDGRTILVPIPKPTPEYKKNLAKQASTITENYKIEVRNRRRQTMDDLKKLVLPKDEQKLAELQIQKCHDDYIKKLDTALKAKEQELSK